MLRSRGWRELAGKLTLQASVDVESNAASSTDRERVLVKTKSTASDDEREEKALKENRAGESLGSGDNPP